MDPESFDRLMLEAIAEEIAARDFYQQAALQMQDPSVAAIFEQLAKEENEHRNTLETFRFNPLARVEFARAQDYRVSEQETETRLSFDMGPKEALQLAMKKEQRAAETYRSLAAACRNPEISRLYMELAEMERGHKCRLEELFVNAAYPECW
jgi:rubrerythrin